MKNCKQLWAVCIIGDDGFGDHKISLVTLDSNADGDVSYKELALMAELECMGTQGTQDMEELKTFLGGYADTLESIQEAYYGRNLEIVFKCIQASNVEGELI